MKRTQQKGHYFIQYIDTGNKDRDEREREREPEKGSGTKLNAVIYNTFRWQCLPLKQPKNIEAREWWCCWYYTGDGDDQPSIEGEFIFMIVRKRMNII